ncbi:PREDICTED: cytochrome b-c1 complex subunit 10-like [Nicrophorus vespilloides]|uniref:Cytochrome b-c1 complex subunit 10-like n=1 Tax=Nicrophorus vespilloides TaxID=110193 RepID=A0ABM1NGL1_NICVS|nr:PREDICTED: cytochrome b-c1 complex subunit 10-like [Nicrophorus vespilloides]
MVLRSLGKKHLEIATKWVGSATAFGASAGMAVVYMTDWKLILQYLPYYNGKFAEK